MIHLVTFSSCLTRRVAFGEGHLVDRSVSTHTCLRTLRLATGMSQTVFGERCGFAQTYLSRLENGNTNPSLNAIEVIANSLGMTVFELFDQVKKC